VNNVFTTVREGLFTQANLIREAPGATYTLRVIAVNAIGESAPSTSAVFSVPFAKSSAPRNLVADTTSLNNRVIFRWDAPESTGGSATVSYRFEYSTNGATWIWMTSTSQLTLTTGTPPKGATYSYRVLAQTSAGNSDPSNVLTVTSSATKSNSPSLRSLNFAADGSVLFAWYAPYDNGGSPITGYRVESSSDGQTFTTLTSTAANVLTATTTRPAPGVRMFFRVFAITALGESNASSVASLQAPFLKASAPQNFAAIDNGSSVAVSWATPTDLGGATSATYRVQVSRDNGATWTTSNSTSSLSTIAVRPNRGSTWLYRVLAMTGFGLGDASNTISIAVAAGAPLAPNWQRIAFATDGNIDLRWFAPSDNGGSVITSYSIEKSFDNRTWTAVATPAFGTTSLSLPRENPGIRVYVRVSATSALGTSPFSSVVSLQMPFLKASAPQNVALQDMQTYVRAGWQAPSELGGSTYVIYHIDYSRDNGATWLRMTSVSSTSANITRPTKGTTWLYRVTTFTSFGLGDSAAPIGVTAATTVSSAPSIRSFTMNPDLTSTLVFNGPTDNGGLAISGYVVERSANASVWSTLTTVGAAGGPVVIEKQAPGTLIYVRVIATNSLGNSPASSWRSLQTPFVQASAVQNLTATPGSSVALRWQAPSDLGGSTSVSYYRIETSADGTNWSTFANISGTSWNLTNPPKGTSMSYRVIAFTNFGASPASNVATVSIATTAPSSVTSLSITRTSPTQLTVTFGRPSDLGGLTEWTYRIERQQGSAYVAEVSGAGAVSNSVVIAAPAANTTVFYRVIATNAKGDSTASIFWQRG
jgi:titin